MNEYILKCVQVFLEYFILKHLKVFLTAIDFR